MQLIENALKFYDIQTDLVKISQPCKRNEIPDLSANCLNIQYLKQNIEVNIIVSRLNSLISVTLDPNRNKMNHNFTKSLKSIAN